MTSMPKPRATRASARPVAPSPTMPSVLPASSVPGGSPTSRAARVRAWTGRRRASPSIRNAASSATDCALAPGTLRTAMPRASAAARSTPSRPAPNCTIALRRGAAAITAASMRAMDGMSAATSATCCSSGRAGSTSRMRSGVPPAAPAGARGCAESWPSRRGRRSRGGSGADLLERQVGGEGGASRRSRGP